MGMHSCFPSCEDKDACLNSNSHSHSSDVHTRVDSITSSIPKINLNCEEILNEICEVKTSPSKSTCHYNLCSLDKKLVSGEPVEGLGMDTSQASLRKPKGRNSYLSMAQVKEKFDVADGKQLSIPGVLRAAKPCKGVTK